jgi:hypothetical protein
VIVQFGGRPLGQKKTRVGRPELFVTKARTIHSEGELDPLEKQIAQSASLAVANLVEICGTGSPLDAFSRFKFESVGFDPLGQRPLNLIEQVNQTFTYLATLAAVRYLFRRHANSAPFKINLGTTPGHDISSQDGRVIAEVFAAVTPHSNQKLKKDACKVNSAQAEHRYVFFASPGVVPGDVPALKNYPGVRIVSLGVAFGANFCAT